ncbi:hypothetical protein FACS189499_06040 [Clostridia bacterium]|nr:hypothetical protein FACS189499_06040 [Clostridia bacterium]
MIRRNDVDGLLLFDKRTGTNYLFDEIQTDAPCLAPRHLSIALTTLCNLDCNHCYIKHDGHELRLTQLKDWVDVLGNNGCLSIGLGGGEPTLWPDIIELADYICATTEMAITLTTNGSANIDFYKNLIPKVNLIRFSMDGLNSTYEQYRKQSFEDLIKTIAELKSDGGNIGINYLLTDRTVSQLDDFVQLANYIQPKEVLLIPLLSRNGKRILAEQSESIIRDWVERNQNNIPLSFSYSSIDFIGDFALPTQDFNPRTQTHYFLHINAQAEIMRSVFDVNPIKIGASLVDALKTIKGESL